MPCPRRPQRGLAKLEFAVSVAVIGVLVTLALGALSRLQLLGDEALRLTTASLQATASAVQLTRCTNHQVSLSTPQPGTAASALLPRSGPPRSCP
jgi:Tfp pilus assembly protein FimT